MKNLLVLFFILFIASCSSNNGEGTYACSGDLTETHEGKTVSGGFSQYKFKENVGLDIKDGRVLITGANEFMPSQLILKKGNSSIGYKFIVCLQKDHEIKFNNYDCDPSLVPKDFGFTYYDGSFNGINGRLMISTRQARPLDITINQSLDLSCNSSKPIF